MMLMSVSHHHQHQHRHQHQQQQYYRHYHQQRVGLLRTVVVLLLCILILFIECVITQRTTNDVAVANQNIDETTVQQQQLFKATSTSAASTAAESIDTSNSSSSNNSSNSSSSSNSRIINRSSTSSDNNNNNNKASSKEVKINVRQLRELNDYDAKLYQQQQQQQKSTAIGSNATTVSTLPLSTASTKSSSSSSSSTSSSSSSTAVNAATARKNDTSRNGESLNGIVHSSSEGRDSGIDGNDDALGSIEPTTYRPARPSIAAHTSAQERERKLMNVLAARRSALQHGSFRTRIGTTGRTATAADNVETTSRSPTDPRSICIRNCTKNFTRRTTASCMRQCANFSRQPQPAAVTAANGSKVFIRPSSKNGGNTSATRTMNEQRDTNEILFTDESSHGLFVVAKEQNDTVNHIPDVAKGAKINARNRGKATTTASIEDDDIQPYLYFGQKLPPIKPDTLAIRSVSDEHPKLLEVSVAHPPTSTSPTIATTTTAAIKSKTLSTATLSAVERSRSRFKYQFRDRGTTSLTRRSNSNINRAIAATPLSESFAENETTTSAPATTTTTTATTRTTTTTTIAAATTEKVKPYEPLVTEKSVTPFGSPSPDLASRSDGLRAQEEEEEKRQQNETFSSTPLIITVLSDEEQEVPQAPIPVAPNNRSGVSIASSTTPALLLSTIAPTLTLTSSSSSSSYSSSSTSSTSSFSSSSSSTSSSSPSSSTSISLPATTSVVVNTTSTPTSTTSSTTTTTTVTTTTTTTTTTKRPTPTPLIVHEVQVDDIPFPPPHEPETHPPADDEANIIVFFNRTIPTESPFGMHPIPTTDAISTILRTTILTSIRSTVNPRTTIAPKEASNNLPASPPATFVGIVETAVDKVASDSVKTDDDTDADADGDDDEDVSYEMDRMNIATMVLAIIGIFPLMAVILYLVRTFMVRRQAKDDEDFDVCIGDQQPISPVKKLDSLGHHLNDSDTLTSDEIDHHHHHNHHHHNHHHQPIIEQHQLQQSQSPKQMRSGVNENGKRQQYDEPEGSVISEQEFDRSNIRLKSLLGEGNFGQVWKAEADDLNGHYGATRIVAVKTIRALSGQVSLKEEAEIMRKLGSHPNVVTLLGACVESEPHMLIMEYAMRGRLLSLLRAARSATNILPASVPGGRSLAPLSPRTLAGFAMDIACGMEYIASRRIVHRDLAARNVLLDHNGVCKICDFGMSIDLDAERKRKDHDKMQTAKDMQRNQTNKFKFDFGGRFILNHWSNHQSNQQHHKDKELEKKSTANFQNHHDHHNHHGHHHQHQHQNGNHHSGGHHNQHGHDTVSKRHALPIRWMAPEALQYHVFTSETDVWAFGIVLWEIATLGSTPYAQYTGREVIRRVPNGLRPELPKEGRHEFYNLMSRCWQKDPRMRPTFTQARQEISRSLHKWVDDDSAASDYMDVSGFSEDLEHGMVYFNHRISEFECEI